MTVAASFRTFADHQDGVLRRSQLTRLGLTEAGIRTELDARRWQAVGPEVIVTHNGPLTYRQQLWAAILTVGPRAALCGRTAATEAGLVGWLPDCIEVVIPRGATVAGGVFQVAGVTVYVHQSRRFTGDDIHPVRSPPQTFAARSIVDAAAWSRRARTACGLLAAGVQQRIVTAASLADELDKAGRVRHRQVMRWALGDIAGGAQALSEIDFGRLCRRHGLPEPVRQVARTEPSGRRRYLDVVLRGPGGQELVVEIDGAAHLLPERYWDDMSRDNELTIAGSRHLRFPTVALYLDEGRVAGQVARALGLVSGRRG